MLYECLSKIQNIIAELRGQLDAGDIQEEAATQIREYLALMERITEQFKEP